MLLDKQLMFSEAQADILTVATHPSTNIIDTGALGLGVSAGVDMELFMKVDAVAFDSTEEDAVLTIVLQTDNDVAFGSPTNLTYVVFAEAALTANTSLFKIKIPHGCERYLRLTYAVSVHAFTAGTMTAGLIIGRQTNNESG